MNPLRGRLYSSLAYLCTTAKSNTMSTTATAQGSLPRLQGVIFDMDGTLTVPNLDFKEMYSRCNVPMDQDILKAISEMSPSDAAKANTVIEEMEEEGRRTLELAPGAVELGKWLNAHKIPMSLVTRNTKRTVDVMMEKLWFPHVQTKFEPSLSRDDCGDLPAKPHPASIFEIQRQWGFLETEKVGKDTTASRPEPGLLMVGDSPKHDVEFGKAAGVSTALVDTGRRLSQGLKDDDVSGADIYVTNLVQLPRKLWNQFEIISPLGHNSPLLKYDKPEPSTPACIAAVAGDLETLLKMSKDELCVTDESGNTPLIWAANADQIDVVKFLLQSQHYEEKDVNVRGYLGATALCRASRLGNVEVLKHLIDAGKADMNIPNDKMQYPLHFAAFKKKTEAVNVLLERGVNTLVFDRKGRTPAEDTSDMNIRDIILEARAKIYGDSLV